MMQYLFGLLFASFLHDFSPIKCTPETKTGDPMIHNTAGMHSTHTPLAANKSSDESTGDKQLLQKTFKQTAILINFDW